MCQCAACGHQEARGSRFRPFAMLVNLAIVYVLLVVGGGTLINTGHPVAVETGRLIQTVTFVQPAITWTDARGFEPVAAGLRLMARGVPVN